MGRSPCCMPEGLKKGPWTQEEDEKLIAFVQEHGHGNWRALPKKCGLLRCGKSCRLRWNNYLRPDIKRGLFTHSEEQKILQLHALVGNKWAFIASQLPKRTDNEIKNYWNTVLKKRLEKLGLSTLMAFGVPGLDSTLIVDTARTHHQDLTVKGMQRHENMQNSNSKGSSNASKKVSCNSSPSVMSCTHLAQWESARLEAEARLAKGSQSGKPHKPFPFAYTLGHSFSSSTSSSSSAFPSLPNHTHTHPPSQLPHLSTSSIPTILSSTLSNPCLIPHASTINLLSAGTSLSLPALPAIISMPSSGPAASSSSSTAAGAGASKSMSSLPSQESIASALTLGPGGRLSWQANELSFAASPARGQASSHVPLISQMLSQSEGGEVEIEASAMKEGRGHELNMEDTSCMVDLNSTMLEERGRGLESTMENWPDLIFDVENACSDVVSTSNWKGPVVPSPPRGEFTQDSPSLISHPPKSGPLQCPLDLEGLNLPHFDGLLSCEPFANHHSHALLKELFLDTPPTLSISSTSIVN